MAEAPAEVLSQIGFILCRLQSLRRRWVVKRGVSAEEHAACQSGGRDSFSVWVGVHYAAHRMPLLAPLHTLTSTHSFSYTYFLKPPINNEGFSWPRLGGRGGKKGHYRSGLHLSKLFHNFRS